MSSGQVNTPEAPPPPAPSTTQAPPPPPVVVIKRGAWTWPRLWENALAFVLGICAVLVIQSAWRLWKPPEPLSAGPGAVDVNTADLGTLRQLPGVGPHLAARIIDHRNKQGSFATVDDLGKVQGIGPATLERLRPVIYVATGQDTLARLQLAPNPTAKPRAPSQPIDINTATRDDLIALPGIGPALAERILEDRETNGVFRSVNDLTRIRGIKAKTLEKLAPFLKVEPAAGKAS
jgi:competence protein ComEA